jgi:Tfp pilus assembly protein PilV
MNTTTYRQRRTRRGTSIAEVSMAVVIASLVMIGIAQLLAMTARQHRVMDRRFRADLEAANVMEDLLSRSFEEIAAETQPKIELSEVFRSALPDANLDIQIAPDDESDDVRRLTVRIDWQNTAQQRTRPVQLVAWKYRQESSQP